MAITDHDRKILWGRAHNRCAICQQPLISDASSEGDGESIVGEEAHVVARSRDGPRGKECLNSRIDSYDNLILLCREHHRVVDDQPNEYPAHRLREIKDHHEWWAEQQLDSSSSQARLRPESPSRPVRLAELRSGRQAWELVAAAIHTFRLDAPQDEQATVEQCDAADEFLGLIKDWGEISSDVTNQGPSTVREAMRSLGESLAELHRHGLSAYGGRRRLILEGGGQQPVAVWELIATVRLFEDLSASAD